MLFRVLLLPPEGTFFLSTPSSCGVVVFWVVGVRKWPKAIVHDTAGPRFNPGSCTDLSIVVMHGLSASSGADFSAART